MKINLSPALQECGLEKMSRLVERLVQTALESDFLDEFQPILESRHTIEANSHLRSQPHTRAQIRIRIDKIARTAYASWEGEDEDQDDKIT